MKGGGINKKCYIYASDYSVKPAKHMFQFVPRVKPSWLFVPELFVLGVAREQSKHTHRNRTRSPIGRWGGDGVLQNVCSQRYRVGGGGKRGPSKLRTNSGEQRSQMSRAAAEGRTIGDKSGGIWCLSKQVAAFWQGSLEDRAFSVRSVKRDSSSRRRNKR